MNIWLLIRKLMHRCNPKIKFDQDKYYRPMQCAECGQWWQHLPAAATIMDQFPDCWEKMPEYQAQKRLDELRAKQ